MRLPWSGPTPPLDLGEPPEPAIVIENAPIDPILVLHQMERALVRAHLDAPYVITLAELRRLRYLISFARLTKFEPDAAGPGGQRGRGDVDVTEDVAAWRGVVIEALTRPLRKERKATQRLALAREVLYELSDQQDQQRLRLIESRANDFSKVELDSEVGYKSMVTVMGGGGGAGYVYFGAAMRMLEFDRIPDYTVGSSIGAVLGSFATSDLPMDIGPYLDKAKTLTLRKLLSRDDQQRRHGMNGVFKLQLEKFAGEMLLREDGTRRTLGEQATPFDVVVSGIHTDLFNRLPSRYKRRDRAWHTVSSLPVPRPVGLAAAVGTRMWQAAAFVDSRVVIPVMLGHDDLTRQLNVVDAAGFSAAIPGVLHHESADPTMWPILDELLETKKVAALVDGGAASNVPVEQAYIQVQRGRIGTRNAAYIAMDCFHPQWDPRHLWLSPITRVISLQMLRNRPYADHLIEFRPTLSPVTLAPGAKSLDQCVEWGKASLDTAVPFVQAFLEPVWWDGQAPPRDGPSRRRNIRLRRRG